MLPQNVYNKRLNEFCSKCEWWDKSRCRKGHLPTSSTGCPVHKFEPINGAGYDDNREPEPVAAEMSCCGNSAEMPDLSWSQVLAMFGQSMVRWARAGLPTVADKTHGNRLRICGECPHKKKFWCQMCKCVCYLKTKLTTEKCPDSRW